MLSQSIISRLFFATLILCSLSTQAFAGDSALWCISTEVRTDSGGNQITKYTNICSTNVYMFWCAVDNPNHKTCGTWNGENVVEKGTYYTNQDNLKPGASRELWRSNGIKYGACYGTAGFSKAVKDRLDGSYECIN